MKLTITIEWTRTPKPSPPAPAGPTSHLGAVSSLAPRPRRIGFSTPTMGDR